MSESKSSATSITSALEDLFSVCLSESKIVSDINPFDDEIMLYIDFECDDLDINSHTEDNRKPLSDIVLEAFSLCSDNDESIESLKVLWRKTKEIIDSKLMEIK